MPPPAIEAKALRSRRSWAWNAGAYKESIIVEESLGHLCNVIYKEEWHKIAAFGEWALVDNTSRFDNQLVFHEGKESLLRNFLIRS